MVVNKRIQQSYIMVIFPKQLNLNAKKNYQDINQS